MIKAVISDEPDDTESSSARAWMVEKTSDDPDAVSALPESAKTSAIGSVSTSSGTYPTVSGSASISFPTTFGTDTNIPGVLVGSEADGNVVEDGNLVVERSEEKDVVIARVAGTYLIAGEGETAGEAVENLQDSLRLLLDYVYGAQGERPTLHEDFLAEVTQLINFGKKLGIYTS